MSVVAAVASIPIASTTTPDINDVPGFGNDPWWLVLLKVLAIFVLLVVLTLFNIWFERRVVARMQHRIGPNKNGPFGLLQSLADGMKLALKEEIIPNHVDKPVYLLTGSDRADGAFQTSGLIGSVIGAILVLLLVRMSRRARV